MVAVCNSSSAGYIFKLIPGKHCQYSFSLEQKTAKTSLRCCCNMIRHCPKLLLLLLMWLMVCCTGPVWAQPPAAEEYNPDAAVDSTGDPVSAIQLMLLQGRYFEAEMELDVYLARQPANADLLILRATAVMHRNLAIRMAELEELLLEQNEEEEPWENMDQEDELVAEGALDAHDLLWIIPRSAENIYTDDHDLGTLEDQAYLTVEMTEETAGWMQRAAAVAPRRQDIYEVLCHLYAHARMTDELLGVFGQMKKQLPATDSLPYVMARYVQQLERYGDYGNTLKLYSALADMYPQYAAFHGYLGNVYYQAGLLEVAHKLYEKAYSLNYEDPTICYRLHLTALLTGDLELADKALLQYGFLAENKAYLFYEGMRRYARADAGWVQDMELFVQEERDTTLVPHLACARLMLANPGRPSPAFLKKLLAALPEPLYALFLYQRTMLLDPRNSEAQAALAELLASHNSFAQAYTLTDSLTQRLTRYTPAQQQRIMQAHAWAATSLGMAEPATDAWQWLYAHRDYACRAAACYFLARLALQADQVETAKDWLKKGAALPGSCKFVRYCDLLSRAMR